MNYAFVLGREPALSIAEILARLKTEGVGYEPKSAVFSPSVLLIDADRPLGADFFHALGGSIKMAEVLHGGSDLENDLYEALMAIDRPNLDFGISLYATEAELSGGYRNLTRGLRPMALTLKKRVKNAGKAVRVVMSDGPALTAVQVDKNNLIEKGAELLVLVGQGSVRIARTVAVQAFEDFSFRDFGRPAADAKSGMLPPKLARLMVNLSGAPKDRPLLDPFCGSGTVLTEALDLGHRNLLASDLSQKAIDDTRANIDWLLEKLEAPKHVLKVFQCDVKDLPGKLEPKSVAAISTEPFLGPPLRGGESDQKIHFIYLELMGLYRRAFEAFAKILTPGAAVVFVFPVFGTKHINLLREFEAFGFKAEALLPGRAAQDLALKSPVGLMYKRPDQKVGREIFRFRYLG